ncbi:MAG: o-succinylbenzoate synthase [Duodenibacillus sp.]|nr:o-succinylbenzoate synthase [Duodenibacillus sp.]
MRIERIVLRRMAMAYRKPFTTSFATFAEKPFYVVECYGGGLAGYGECAATPWPLYNEEHVDGAYEVTRRFLAPRLAGRDIAHPSQVRELLRPVRRNNIAKAALEQAAWDLWAKQQGVSLSKALGGTRTEVETGVSIGLQPTTARLVEAVGEFLDQGYRRIKIKIKPGRDVSEVRAVREAYGDIPLQVDANSAYTLADIAALKALDAYGLLLIEQPLAHDDIIDHRLLQSQLATPLCLDESIDSADDARQALELGSCRIINIKVARVGGLEESRRIHDAAQAAGAGVWCGGMLDAGVAKAHCIAIASLPGFIYPGDITPSSRNFAADYIEPAFEMKGASMIAVPRGPGIGVEINRELYERYTLATEVIRL